jgi:membrane fusion protein (multidrug efflux system)
MNHLKILIALGSLALCLTSCTGKEGTSATTEQGMPVKVQEVQYIAESTQNTYVGVVEESQSIPLSFLTTGTVEKVQVNEGESVSKGQLLASLNSFSYQNAYQLAASKEKQAQDAFDRLSGVYKNGSLPEVKMVEIETGLEQAKSLVQIAKKNIDDCNLYAPASGMVGRKSIEPGMNIIPVITVITLVKIDKVFIKVSVPENEIAGISLGQKAFVTVPALKDEIFSGKVEQKGVMANLLSHTYEIKIAIANRGDQLRPGMVCNVSLTKPAADNIISVPQQVVQIDNSGARYVFKADSNQGKAIRKYIETGTLLGNGNIVVTSGLEKGDLVIIDGYQKINENAPIQIIR